MKLLSFLLFVGMMTAHATGLSQTVTLSGRNLTLKQVFAVVKKQTGYVLFSNNVLLAESKTVSLNVRNMPIEDFLQVVLREQSLDYVIQARTIFLSRKENADPLRTMDTAKKDEVIAVHGRIVNEKGDPLLASVIIKGKEDGTGSNYDGRFYLDVATGTTLVISSVGYKGAEVRAARELGTVVLKAVDSRLEEVIVKAYGTTTRRLNTGNISKVTSEQIERQPVTNPLAALEGKVPGLVVTQTTGLPGGQFKVEIQGRTAIDRGITDDQPLFIIDGIPTPTNNDPINRQWSSLGAPDQNRLYNGGRLQGMSPFSGLNPNDIESIEVLKGGDATAIYGSRGANGVVLITTKKGKPGFAKMDVNISTGVSKVARKVEYASTAQYVAMRKAAFMSDGVTPDQYNAYDILVWDTTRYTDMNKLLVGNAAPLTNANLSFSGGSENIQYLLSTNYRHQSTILPGNNSDKTGTVHFNIGASSTNHKFKAALTGSYGVENNNLPLVDLATRRSVPPNLRIYDDAGNLAWNEGGVVTQDGLVPNPLAYLNNSYQLKVRNLTSSLQLSYAIIKDLVIRTNLGYSAIQTNETGINPSSGSNPAANTQRISEFNTNEFTSNIIELQLEYNKQINKSKISVLAGGSYQATYGDGNTIRAAGYSSDNLMNSLVGYTSVYATKYRSEYKYEALFGQLNINHNSKYLLNAGIRRDGSSRFGPDKRFSTFGSVGAAWLFANERAVSQWMPWLSFGKLRTSYGITGNDKISSYQYLDTWMTPTSLYDGSSGLYPSKLYNGDYHWEKSNKFEAAVELGFIKNRILFTANYYRNLSNEPLVQYLLPAITGFISVIKNLPAKVSNTGWEFTLNTNNLETKNFSWATSINLTLPKNKLVSFDDLVNSSYANTYVVGEPLDLIYKYKYMGVDRETGLSILEDKNKDGMLTPGGDYQVLGSMSPKFYGGLSNTFKYKSLQLDVLFSFRKQKGFSYLNELGGAPGGMNNLPAKMSGFWTKPGDDARFQRLTQTYGDAYFSWSSMIWDSDRPYEDASFIRLRNVSLSLGMPDRWLRRCKINSARLYVQGQNLLTITNYEVGDPETQSLQSTPPLKTVIVGLQFSL